MFGLKNKEAANGESFFTIATVPQFTYLLRPATRHGFT